MPRYYFHYDNSEFLRDEVGQEVADEHAARQVALQAAGELIGEHIARGEPVDLGHAIVAECGGEIRFKIIFRDLVILPEAVGTSSGTRNSV